jgi:hypothetical protein
MCKSVSVYVWVYVCVCALDSDPLSILVTSQSGGQLQAPLFGTPSLVSGAAASRAAVAGFGLVAISHAFDLDSFRSPACCRGEGEGVERVMLCIHRLGLTSPRHGQIAASLVAKRFDFHCNNFWVELGLMSKQADRRWRRGAGGPKGIRRRESESTRG